MIIVLKHLLYCKLTDVILILQFGLYNQIIKPPFIAAIVHPSRLDCSPRCIDKSYFQPPCFQPEQYKARWARVCSSDRVHRPSLWSQECSGPLRGLTGSKTSEEVEILWYKRGPSFLGSREKTGYISMNMKVKGETGMKKKGKSWVALKDLI